jgi:tetratricopeptide (TPR) repeat protein
MAVAFVPSLFLIDMLQGRSMRDLRSWLTKLPFIALALAIGILAIKVQDKALDEVDLAFWKRATIAAQNLPTYMAQQFLPLWSSPYYAYPTMAEGVLPWHYFLLALVAVAVPVWLLFERPPVLYTFSLLFFFFNIALVLQLLPVGHAVRADRYTYVAGIGWALLAALLIRDLCRIFRPKAHSLMFGMAYAVLLGMVAQGQVPVWKNALSVWDRIILDNPTSSIMYLNRSVTLTTAGRTNEALADLDMAVRHARPNDPMPIFLRGRFHMHQGSFDKAIEDFDRMTRTDVVPEGYLQSLAYALYKRGRCPEVIDLANKGLADQGPSIDLLNLRAHCSLQLGDLVQATTDLDRSSSIRQDYGEIWVLLGLASLARGDTLNGCTQLRQSNHWALFEKDLEQQRDQLIARYCPAIP